MQLGLYKAKKGPQYYHGKLIRFETVHGRPVNKVEVVKIDGKKVCFQTDCPVQTFVISKAEFLSKFDKW